MTVPLPEDMRSRCETLTIRGGISCQIRIVELNYLGIPGKHWAFVMRILKKEFDSEF